MYKFGLISGFIIFLIAAVSFITFIYIIIRKISLHQKFGINIWFLFISLIIVITTYDMDKSFINFILSPL